MTDVERVQVENYVPGKLKELGLDYDTCRELNPKLIYASISGEPQLLASTQAPAHNESQVMDRLDHILEILGELFGAFATILLADAGHCQLRCQQ